RNPCIGTVCLNGGSCISPFDIAICQCPSRFGGKKCENQVPVKIGRCPDPVKFILDPCDRFVCLNGGSCNAPADAPFCECPALFTGASCENYIPDGTCPI
ncbi:unnamed protein product, partial [Candidula unifasciata]